jgi:hypothetical protein
MARQTINVGRGPNSLDGDVIRNAFIKVNQNFIELYQYNDVIPDTIAQVIQDVIVNGSHTGITAVFDNITGTINLTGFSGNYNDLVNLPRLDIDGGSPSDIYLAAGQGFDGGSASAIYENNNLDGGGVQ